MPAIGPALGQRYAAGGAGLIDMHVDIHEVLVALERADRTTRAALRDALEAGAASLESAVRRALPRKTGRWAASLSHGVDLRAGEHAFYSAWVKWRTTPYAGVNEFGGDIPNPHTHGAGHPRHRFKPRRPEGYFVYPTRDREKPRIVAQIDRAIYLGLRRAGWSVERISEFSSPVSTTDIDILR